MYRKYKKDRLEMATASETALDEFEGRFTALGGDQALILCKGMMRTLHYKRSSSLEALLRHDERVQR